jgi:type-F conjugative transfer system pilin assembly protein TrbC
MCYGGSETVVYCNFIIFAFLSLSVLAIDAAAQNSDIEAAAFIENIKNNQPKSAQENAQEIVDLVEEIKKSNKFEKDAAVVIEKAQKAEKSKTYQSAKTWIDSNKTKIFARQQEVSSQNLQSTRDNEKANKDAITQLLNSYNFKQNDIQKSQIIHYPVMIFVSSSIPQQSLKDLMLQARKTGAVLVFRGFIGNLRNTAEFMQRLTKDNVSAIIDPRLFEMFKIERVPTFVVASNDIQGCEGSSCSVTPQHDRISGNITLNFALEQIANGKGSSKSVAEKYLKKLEGGQK